ncbi:substrate-binding domain-containing protein [Streptomyces sp. NPDC101151]|uniref:phosphorylase family protein n=1 Tax=Streptomyces sp. NPDC101151 TaxID=3366115 RepID=UPI003802EB5D
MADTSSGPVAVILTALHVEYDAVRARLEDLTRSSESGTIFERGRLPGSPWTVVLAQTGPGNDNAAVVTKHAYDLYRPRVLFFVGVAGGLKDDVRIGDVVIGERIYDYREKQSPRGGHYRPRGWEAPWWLVQHVQRIAFGSEVAGRVRVAPIASGNVVLDRETSELGELLRGNYDDAVAIEMESAGVCRAAHLVGGLDTLTIRGISDKADGGKHRADSGGSQEIAAWCAAATAVRILTSLPPERTVGASAGPDTVGFEGRSGAGSGSGSASPASEHASAAGTDASEPGGGDAVVYGARGTDSAAAGTDGDEPLVSEVAASEVAGSEVPESEVPATAAVVSEAADDDSVVSPVRRERSTPQGSGTSAERRGDPPVPPARRRRALLPAAAGRVRLGERSAGRLSGRTRAVLVACVAMAVAGALVAFLLKATGDSGTDDKNSALARCSLARVKLHVAASIDVSTSLSEAAAQYNARTSTDGTCVKVEVSSVNSGTAMRALATGWGEDDGDRPDVWSPAGSEWLTLARARAKGAAKRLLPETAEPIVTSPLTIAMPKPMAEALGWPESTIGWGKLAEWAADPAKFWESVGQKQWGAFKLGKTNPSYSTSGLNATIGAYYAKTRTSAELSAEDIDAPDNQAFVRAIEKSVVHYGDTTLTFLANLRAADDRGGADEALKYISAVTVEEDAVVAYNEGYPCGAYSKARGCEKRSRPRTPLVSFYPSDSDPVSDHPYVELAGMGKVKRPVARDFLAYLHRPEVYGKYFAPYGFRTHTGAAGAAPALSPDNGALPTASISQYAAPDGDVLDRLQTVWPTLRRRANVLVLIDTSKSMGDKVPGTGGSKMELLRNAEPALFGGLAATDRVGLWKFSNAAGLDGKHHYVPLVDIGPMGEKPAGRGGATRRAVLADEVGNLVPSGATGLYGTVEAAVDAMRKDYDPGAINAIVLLTDGRNEGVPPTPSLKQVLAGIGTPEKRVRVFTVAYGSQADQQDSNGRTVLEEIAAATGAHAYDAKNPNIISEVLTSVISNF